MVSVVWDVGNRNLMPCSQSMTDMILEYANITIQLFYIFLF